MEAALAVFARLNVMAKVAKCLLLLGRYNDCVRLASSSRFGVPTMEEIKTMARTLGRERDLEEFIASQPSYL